MAKTCLFAVVLFILISQTGCGPLPIKMKEPDYSIGPVSFENFPDLVQAAIPANKGEVRLSGKAIWMGFFESPGIFHVVSPYFSGVVALTDTDIFLLLYNDEEQRYEVLSQVPYTGISFDPNDGWSAGGPLYLYIEEPELALGEKIYTPDARTSLEFVRPTGIRSDSEKNRLAHLLFEEKVSIHAKQQAVLPSEDQN